MKNSLERLQAFDDFIKACESTMYGGENQWVGCGNPLSPILIIGKEPANDMTTDEEISKEIEDNVKKVRCCFDNGDLARLFIQKYNPTRGSTWRRYQCLIDYIMYGEVIERKEKQNLPFGMWAFITEMNNTTSKNTRTAKKKLEYRKKLFADSKFIRDFPIVILACGKDYINNDEDHWEINNIFNVEFKMDGGAHEEFGKGYEFYLHYSTDSNRLVIHTQQISRFLGDDPLKSMAYIIRKHLRNKGKFPNFFWKDED